MVKYINHIFHKLAPNHVTCMHNDIIKWKYFPRYWPFVRGIHRSLVNSPHKDQWCGALVLSLICAWINGWVNNREAGDLRCHGARYDVTVMFTEICCTWYKIAAWIFCKWHQMPWAKLIVAWYQRIGSTLPQVMPCCLMAPSHYLYQCWLILSSKVICGIHLRAISQEELMSLTCYICVWISHF